MASATFLACILLSAAAAAAAVSGRKCRPASTLQSSPWGECVVRLDSPTLPTLSWVYTSATNTVSISFTDSALSSGGWVGWGINLNATTMAGADVLIGFGQQLRLYKLSAALYGAAPPPLVPVNGFDDGIQMMSNMTLEVRNSTEFTIVATMKLPDGVEAINTIYNRGPVAGGMPAGHGEGQRNGMKTIHLATGKVVTSAAAELTLLRGFHAALAAASWGIMLPIGAIIGRYGSRLSAPPPHSSSWWFNTHASTQCAAYLGGSAAWALGLRLGSLSPSFVFRQHRYLGIAIFALATFQVCSALFARPHKVAAEIGRFWQSRRFWWEISHRTTAATILLLSIINVFKGFDILRPSPKFRSAYIAFLTLAACACVALEANYCRHLFLRSRRRWRFHHDDHNNMAAIHTKQQAPSAAILPMVPPPSHD